MLHISLKFVTEIADNGQFSNKFAIICQFSIIGNLRNLNLQSDMPLKLIPTLMVVPKCRQSLPSIFRNCEHCYNKSPNSLRQPLDQHRIVDHTFLYFQLLSDSAP